MTEELDTVVLQKDFEQYGLERGDVGTIVHRSSSTTPETFEIEFVTAEGETVAVLTLGEDEIRPMHSNEILHARTRISA